MGLPQRPEVRRPQEQNQSPTPKAARGGGAWVVIASGRARAVVDDTASTSCWHNSSCLKFVDDSVERTREVLKVGDLAVKKSWSDQNLSEFSKVNLIGQI